MQHFDDRSGVLRVGDLRAPVRPCLRFGSRVLDLRLGSRVLDLRFVSGVLDLRFGSGVLDLRLGSTLLGGDCGGLSRRRCHLLLSVDVLLRHAESLRFHLQRRGVLHEVSDFFATGLRRRFSFFELLPRGIDLLHRLLHRLERGHLLRRRGRGLERLERRALGDRFLEGLLGGLTFRPRRLEERLVFLHGSLDLFPRRHEVRARGRVLGDERLRLLDGRERRRGRALTEQSPSAVRRARRARRRRGRDRDGGLIARSEAQPRGDRGRARGEEDRRDDRRDRDEREGDDARRAAALRPRQERRVLVPQRGPHDRRRGRARSRTCSCAQFMSTAMIFFGPSHR